MSGDIKKEIIIKDRRFKIFSISEAEQNAFERLNYLQGIISDDEHLVFNFARNILPSAIAAYGRPIIDFHTKNENYSVTFEWKNMFWLFETIQITVVIDGITKKILKFSQNDFKEFVKDYKCIPSEMPNIGNQSEFDK